VIGSQVLPDGHGIPGTTESCSISLRYSPQAVVARPWLPVGGEIGWPKSVVTSLAGFAGGRTAIPAAFRQAPAVSREVARSPDDPILPHCGSLMLLKLSGKIQTLSVRFSIFRALYISMGVNHVKEPRFDSLVAARQGDWCMKDTDHPMRHPRVHLLDRACARRRRSCARQNGQYGRGMAPSWAGATPLRCHGKRGGRSSSTNGSRDQYEACCAAMRSENPDRAAEEGKNYFLQLRLLQVLQPVVRVISLKRGR